MLRARRESPRSARIQRAGFDVPPETDFFPEIFLNVRSAGTKVRDRETQSLTRETRALPGTNRFAHSHPGSLGLFDARS